MSDIRKYQIIKKQKPKGLCKICGENKSDSRIDVQVNNFRGDDDVFNIHNKCFKEIGVIAFMEIIEDK